MSVIGTGPVAGVVAPAGDHPGGGPPWVLLHGFLGQPHGYAEVAPALAVGSRSAVHLVRLPGHGPTPWFPPEPTWSATCEAIAAALPPRARLCGYSMGGRLALGVAARAPARVEQLVLVSAHPGLADPSARARRSADDHALAVRLRGAGLEAFVDLWEALPLFETQRALDPARRARRRHERLDHTRDGIAWVLEHLGPGDMPDLHGALAGLRCPIMLVTGALDAGYTSLAAALARQQPRLTHLVVPDSGHDVVLEAPVALANHLAALAPVRAAAPGRDVSP